MFFRPTCVYLYDIALCMMSVLTNKVTENKQTNNQNQEKRLLCHLWMLRFVKDVYIQFQPMSLKKGFSLTNQSEELFGRLWRFSEDVSSGDEDVKLVKKNCNISRSEDVVNAVHFEFVTLLCYTFFIYVLEND